MNLLNHDEGFFIWEVLIFFIFVLVLAKVAWKPLIEYLQERQKNISDSLAAVENLKKEIEQLKKESEVVKAKAQGEVLDIQIYTKEYAEKMLKEAETEAKAVYKSIIDDTLLYVEKLRLDAINELKSKAGKMVVEAAENILRNELSAKARQEEHIKGLIKEINLNKEIQQ
jgi:F-type H+-transporting ATPase subunit b